MKIAPPAPEDAVFVVNVDAEIVDVDADKYIAPPAEAETFVKNVQEIRVAVDDNM